MRGGLLGVLLALSQLGCGAPRTCPRREGGAPFVDPEIVAMTPAQRAADLRFLVALLEQSYPHLAEKQRRFGVRVRVVVAGQRGRLMAARNRYQYMNAVDRVLLAFHDGHLTTRGFARSFRNTYQPPAWRAPKRTGPRPKPVRVGVGLELRYLRGQVVVVRVRPGSPAARAGVRPGDVLLLVGQTGALSRLGSSLRWRGWSRLSAGLQYAASRVMVSRPWYPDTPMPEERVTILRGRQRRFVTLRGAPTPPLLERAAGLRRLPGGVGLLTLRTFAGPRERLWARIAGLMDKARSSRGIILDLRGNRGGAQGIAHRLVARLIGRPVVVGRYRYRRSPEIAKRVPIVSRLPADPTDPRWTRWQAERIEPAAHPYPGPVQVIVDELCASACETVARAARATPKLTLYGRPTAGSSGLPVRVVLPESRLVISLPTWQSRTADGLPVEGRGVRPEVRVALSLEALRSGRDLAVERALADLAGPPASR